MMASPGSAVWQGATPEDRARRSRGTSDQALYRMVAAALPERPGGVLIDVGCGAGNLLGHVKERFGRYIGVDVVRYEGFPEDREFIRADLDRSEVPLPAACADAVVAVETIEHLENPRAFMREMARLAKPGGAIAVTTPNNLSLLSLLTLAVKGRFQAFQDVHYPAHITALIEADLRRIAQECGLSRASVAYSQRGRVALTPRYYPRWLSKAFPRALSDHLLLLASK